jgi:YHS domain-containing protein
MAMILAGTMFGAIVAAALAVDGLFAAADLVPKTRPDIDSITDRGVTWNYTTFLNILFLGVAAALVALTLRRGARDPVCGMTVDRSTTLFRSEWNGKTVYFCSAGCKERFDADPERYLGGGREVAPLAHAGEHHH